MSFLDIDEHLIELDAVAQIVWSPLVDTKEFPPDVVVTLVEGAVSSEEDFHKIKMIRERTQILVSLGDCAVTANVPGMRNQFKTKDVLDRAYIENADQNQHIPLNVIPRLREQSVPVHQAHRRPIRFGSQ
jgi:NAD-reducing hydrogenase small subunit